MSKSNSRTRIFIVALMFGVTACATPSYAPPQVERMARLEVFSPGKMNAFAYRDASTCSGRQMVLRVGEPAGTKKSIQVAAGEPFTLTLTWDSHAKFTAGLIEFVGCAPTATFIPQPGETYMAGRVDNSRCELYLKNAEGNAVDFTKRQWKNGNSESSSFCR